METEYRIEDFDAKYARVMIKRAIKNALEEERKSKKEECLSAIIFAGVVIELIIAATILINFT